MLLTCKEELKSFNDNAWCVTSWVLKSSPTALIISLGITLWVISVTFKFPITFTKASLPIIDNFYTLKAYFAMYSKQPL